MEAKGKIKDMSKQLSEMDKELEAVLGAHRTRIRIVGAGGAGCNTITRLLEVGINGVEAIAVNTDAQDLLFAKANQKILIGRNITSGLGAGSDPRVGEESARENTTEIESFVADSDMVFVTCGLGGGTGTGSAPIIAEIARNSGALTIAVVTLPFTEEGVVRRENAQEGLRQLQDKVDTVIVVQNDRLLEMSPDMPLHVAFKQADEILVNAVKGITELVTEKGLVNLDFADVRTIMKNGGMAMIGLGESDSDNSAEDAALKALENPLLDVDITGARSALINITGGQNMSLKSAKTVMKVIADRLDPEARIIWGARLDQSIEQSLRVMLIATCLKNEERSQTRTSLSVKRNQPSVNTRSETSEPVPEEMIAEPTQKTAAQAKESSDSGVAPKDNKPGDDKPKDGKVEKKGGQVFSEIFVDETKADLFVLEDAVKELTPTSYFDNEKSLRKIKNALASIRSSAELFSFNRIANLLTLIITIIEKNIEEELEVADTLVSAFGKLPSVLKEMVTDQQQTHPAIGEIEQEFSNILSGFEDTKEADADDREMFSSGEHHHHEVHHDDRNGKNAFSGIEAKNDSTNFKNVDEAVKLINKLF